MKNWKRLLIKTAVLAAIWNVPAAFGQSRQLPANSVPSSPSSDTAASKAERHVSSPGTPAANRSDVIAACMATAVELEKARVTVSVLDGVNRLLTERLETEKRATAVLTELNETRKNENDALRAAVTAKNETISAKDAAIASQDKLIEALKKKKTSPWRRVGDILIGAAAGLILR